MTDSVQRLLASYKRPLCYLMGTLYVVAGVLHFLAPETYARVVPPQLPRPTLLVSLSGLAEVLLGLGVLFDRTRRPSAYGLMALLVAVFPANVYMATSDVTTAVVPDRLTGLTRLALWARLPLQAVLIWWAWWYTQPTEPDVDAGNHDGTSPD